MRKFMQKAIIDEWAIHTRLYSLFHDQTVVGVCSLQQTINTLET